MRCTCDCRALSQAKKVQKKAEARMQQVQAMLVGFSAEEEEELMAVEGALASAVQVDEERMEGEDQEGGQQQQVSEG